MSVKEIRPMADDEDSAWNRADDGTDDTPTQELVVPAGIAEADGPARPFPAPGSSGFADPLLLAGRPMSDHLHIVVLILAAGADMGAFYQVIARAMGDSSEFFVFLVLIGFTATVLYLGHVIGLTLRNHKAKYDTASLAAVAFCVFVLAGLGAVAFYVRLTIPTSSSGQSGGFSSAPTAAAAEAADDTRIVAAAVFLGLYAATVTVAAMGAYMTHNPLREGYAAAIRAHRKQATLVAGADAAHIRDMSLKVSATVNREAARQIEQAERHRVLALAEELKRVAQVRMLAAQKDPALTDSWSPDDPRPYEFAKYGPPNG
jgi:hypothetical protein